MMNNSGQTRQRTNNQGRTDLGDELRQVTKFGVSLRQ